MILIVKILLMLWIGLSVIVFTFQRWLIYVPDKTPPHLTRFDKKKIAELRWVNSDHIHLMAYYHPARQNQPTIVIFHGNAGNIGSRKILMHQLIEEGYGVLMPEYRGYGGLGGFPTEKSLYRDAYSAIDYLKSLGIDEKNMIIFGESLGAAVALQVALEYPVAGLILQSPFLSLQSMAKLHYPWNILPVLDDFSNEKKIERLHIPLLIIHGTQDELVPIEQGKTLFAKAIHAPSKKLALLEGQGHNLTWDDEYLAYIRAYIEKNFHYYNTYRLYEAPHR